MTKLILKEENLMPEMAKILDKVFSKFKQKLGEYGVDLQKKDSTEYFYEIDDREYTLYVTEILINKKHGNRYGFEPYIRMEFLPDGNSSGLELAILLIDVDGEVNTAIETMKRYLKPRYDTFSESKLYEQSREDINKEFNRAFSMVKQSLLSFRKDIDAKFPEKPEPNQFNNRFEYKFNIILKKDRSEFYIRVIYQGERVVDLVIGNKFGSETFKNVETKMGSQQIHNIITNKIKNMNIQETTIGKLKKMFINESKQEQMNNDELDKFIGKTAEGIQKLKTEINNHVQGRKQTEIGKRLNTIYKYILSLSPIENHKSLNESDENEHDAVILYDTFTERGNDMLSIWWSDNRDGDGLKLSLSELSEDGYGIKCNKRTEKIYYACLIHDYLTAIGYDGYDDDTLIMPSSEYFPGDFKKNKNETVYETTVKKLKEDLAVHQDASDKTIQKAMEIADKKGTDVTIKEDEGQGNENIVYWDYDTLNINGDTEFFCWFKDRPETEIVFDYDDLRYNDKKEYLNFEIVSPSMMLKLGLRAYLLDHMPGFNGDTILKRRPH